MPSETDPLLPRNTPAPEISGYGFSKSSTQYLHLNEIVEEESTAEAPTDEPSNQRDAGPPPLRSLLSLFTVVVGFALFISLLIPGNGGPWQDDGPPSIKARVDKILSETPLIDGHVDLAIVIRYLYHNKIYSDNFTEDFEKGGMRFHVDLPRLEEGKLGGAFWAAYVGCPANGTDFSDANYAPVISTTLSQIDLLHRLISHYSSTFSLPSLNSTTALASFTTEHTLISPLAIEGLHQIGNSISNLRLYHALSVRYATLTHNCHNAFADAALLTSPTTGTLIAAPPYWGGVSPRGQLAIKEMNRLGMLVDLSHVSKNTMRDVLGDNPQTWNGSAASVIFSHSSSYTLCPHPRNVPDDILALVKKTNSLVMINFSPDFISCHPPFSPSTGLPTFYPQNSTLHQVARHIMYIGDRIGYNYVGLGSDFDGMFETPRGLEDVSKYPDLVAELLRMGMGDEDVGKIVGGNLLRVWGSVEEVSEKMQSEGVLPVEDWAGFEGMEL